MLFDPPARGPSRPALCGLLPGLACLACLCLPALSAAESVHDAIAASRVVEAQKMLEADLTLVNQRNAAQQTPLFLAAARGQLKLVAWLLDHGADIEAADGNQMTPVQVAAQGNALAVVKLLVEHGANLTVRDKKGRNALGAANSHPWGEIVEYIKNAEATDTPPGAAPSMNPAMKAALIAVNLAQVKAALKDEPEQVWSRDDTGQTPLMIAALGNSVEIMTELLAKQAAVNAIDKQGQTALALAVGQNNPATVKLLLDHQADPNLADKTGRKPAALALGTHKDDLVAMLTAAGANTEPAAPGASPENLPALLPAVAQAAGQDQVAVMQALLAQHPEQARAVTPKGFTALIIAAGSGRTAIVACLLDSGADVNHQDDELHTALHRAAKNGYLDCVKLLVAHGANLALKEKFDGSTAEAMAAARNHPNIANFLKTAAAGNAAGDGAGGPGAAGGTLWLADFEDPNQLQIWTFKDGAGQLDPAHATGGKQSLKTTTDFYLSAWRPTPGDWSPYASFEFDIFVVGTTPVTLTLIITDQAFVDNGGDYYDRHNEILTVLPGAHTIKVPVQKIFRGEIKKPSPKLSPNLDPTKITRVDIGVKSTANPVTVYLDSIRLVKKKSAAAANAPLPGLAARFFAGRIVGAAPPLVERVDSQIDFDWGGNSPVRGVPGEDFCVRWTGILRVEKPGRYTLALVSDDGVRLTVDGRLVIDQWVGQPAARTSGEMDLAAGDHDLQLDYFQGTVDASCRFSWSLQDGFAEQIVPARALWHRPDQGGLLAAIYRSDLSAVQAAVTAVPALATTPDSAGRTALNLAAVADSKILSYLLEQKADPNLADAENWRPIHVAAEAGRADLATVLLKAGADANVQAAPGNQTPLYIAAEFGFTAVVKQLLIFGANPNLATSRGATPLQRAAEGGYIDIVSLLILAKADLNARDQAGKTALDYAVAARHLDVAALLTKGGATGTTPLPALPAADVTPLAAGKKADPNATRDPEKETAFLTACARADAAQMDALLAQDPNLVFSRDISGYTGLHLLPASVQKATPAMAQKLLDLGLTIDVPHKWKRTPLHRACELGCMALAKFYIEKGADINARDGSGVTPLIFAARGGNTPFHREILTLLLDRKADATARDNDDNLTAYGWAKKEGFAEIIKILEDHGIKE